jgi:hypothetical protein
LELETRRLAVLKLAGLSIRRPLYRLMRQGTDRSAAMSEFLKML